eukprot:TRINITY_DN4852_c0_g1_i1.p1 TRINITY_DN4852_c0_g1~~TRINITY_DN4852_c0_g1_i1.p1  ORF type:complete len:908 (+),score=266.14 TRINITY_DN4852_c0_g1_i1:2798-5521(+)
MIGKKAVCSEAKSVIEASRLKDSELRKADWKNWGPYLSERSWGTVREDYSEDGSAWDYFPHDHARSRTYRWNEDGIAGICNRFQNICLSVALWNGKDPIIKERLFGLTGNEGNHGEDVKEYYWYLDNIPSHSYMKMLYKYPQEEFPYGRLVDEAKKRTRSDPEFELGDTGIFDQDRYFDVTIEYFKADQEDILCQITAVNRGPDDAELTILPHLWFRNTWSWGYNSEKPSLSHDGSSLLDGESAVRIDVEHRHLGKMYYYVDKPQDLMFTENETNKQKLWKTANESQFVKDGINDAVVTGNKSLVSRNQGTKFAPYFHKVVGSGDSFTVRVRLSPTLFAAPAEAFSNFDSISAARIKEANEFYALIQPNNLSDEERKINRQALSGLLWSKQFYHFGVDMWLKGDPAYPAPTRARYDVRNGDWRHLYTTDVLSMPDKWEYPWFAAWDLAFHCVPLALVDPEWAKRQLILMLRDWYMHPNGQIPAYEWNFSDTNPPVHAWACLEVYKTIRRVTGKKDIDFLEKVFHKLLINFTWWVNKKDPDGNNIFSGGFLGLDNIGVIDRSAPLPSGRRLLQADGTSWMGMYCLDMLSISLKLAKYRPSYADVASKFLEHFIYIGHSLNKEGSGLWDEEDGFFYDRIHIEKTNTYECLKVKSFVGLIPFFGVTLISEKALARIPIFKNRLDWFIKHRPHLLVNIHSMTEIGGSEKAKGSKGGYRILSLVPQERLERVCQRMMDPKQFLSDYGVRSLSREHLDNPFTYNCGEISSTVRYESGETSLPMYGGNSNWRGPVWFPVNYLLIDSLRKSHKFYQDRVSVQIPDGRKLNLIGMADEISDRLINIFKENESGDRPAHLSSQLYKKENWGSNLQFFEYFDGDNGTGLGASHQTGWTALVASLINRSSVKRSSFVDL